MLTLHVLLSYIKKTFMFVFLSFYTFGISKHGVILYNLLALHVLFWKENWNIEKPPRTLFLFACNLYKLGFNSNNKNSLGNPENTWWSCLPVTECPPFVLSALFFGDAKEEREHSKGEQNRTWNIILLPYFSLFLGEQNRPQGGYFAPLFLPLGE